MNNVTFKRTFIKFSKAVISHKKSTVLASFEIEGKKADIGCRYVNGEGGTVYMKFNGEALPLCAVSEDGSKYKLNVGVFYPIIPTLRKLEDSTSIFSKTASVNF